MARVKGQTEDYYAQWLRIERAEIK